MNSIEKVRDLIKDYYSNGKNLRLNVNISKQKVHLKEVEAKILGVYSNVFRIEDLSCGKHNCYTLQYTDVILKQIEILQPV